MVETGAQILKRKRTHLGVSIADMALYLDVARPIYEILESGGVTHPNIARRIGEKLGMSEEQIGSMMPNNQNELNPDYDPNKYKSPKDLF